MCTSFGANPVALQIDVVAMSIPGTRLAIYTHCNLYVLSLRHAVVFDIQYGSTFSTHPFFWAWKELVSPFFDPKISYTCCATWAVNSLLLSESNNLGHPHLVTYAFAKIIAHPFDVFSSAVTDLTCRMISSPLTKMVEGAKSTTIVALGMSFWRLDTQDKDESTISLSLTCDPPIIPFDWR